MDFPSGFPIKSQIVFSKSKIVHIFPAGSIHWWWIFQYFQIFFHDILWIAYWLLKRNLCACQRQPSRDGQRRLKKPLLRLGAAGVTAFGWTFGNPQEIWWQCGKSRKRNYKLGIVIGSYGENFEVPKIGRYIDMMVQKYASKAAARTRAKDMAWHGYAQNATFKTFNQKDIWGQYYH